VSVKEREKGKQIEENRKIM